MEAFADLAQNKIPLMSAGTLSNRPIAQYADGRGGGQLSRGAYARTCMQAMRGCGRRAARRRASDRGQRPLMNARLACTHGANVCMQVVDRLHNTAGTSGHAHAQSRWSASSGTRTRARPTAGSRTRCIRTWGASSSATNRIRNSSGVGSRTRRRSRRITQMGVESLRRRVDPWCRGSPARGARFSRCHRCGAFSNGRLPTA